MTKKIIAAAALAAVLTLLFSCAAGGGANGGTSGGVETETAEFAVGDKVYRTTETETDTVLIMTSAGNIIVELYPDIAPITVANFKSLVARSYYDGTIFHRVIKDFMIQGGQGATSVPQIKGEFSANGVQNDLKHVRGVLSMARANAMDSASSQFFICHGDAAWLDGQYAAFGRVISGMDAVDRIAVTQTDSNDRPLTDQVMIKVLFLAEK